MFIEPARPATSTPAPVATNPFRTNTPIALNTPNLGVTLVYTPGAQFQPQRNEYRWSNITIPQLSSPTAYMTPSPGGSSSGETDGLIDDVGGFVSTVSAIDLTPGVGTIVAPDGTTVDFEAQLDEYENNFSLLIAYLKGLDPNGFGNMSVLIQFSMLAGLGMLIWQSILMLAPVISAFVGFIVFIVGWIRQTFFSV